MSRNRKKATNKRLNFDYLQNRAAGLVAAGFHLELYEARQTKSKYITVRREGDWSRSYKVRFSDHKPIHYREMAGDCDFFVGVTHTGTRNTHDAINAVCNFFGVQRVKGFENPKMTGGYIADFI